MKARRVLLDTCTFLWWCAGDARLSARAHQLITGSRTTVYVSAISAWEMEIKAQLGRLRLPRSGADFVAAECAANALTFVPFRLDDVVAFGRLPVTRHDPFDRALAAQALALDAPILSPDVAFDALGVAREW
ncbi:MAG: type II toxin-antitoxin system VapC family toxin [Gemmatimonadaceae bacterium]|nr:type II toxin-antitoxin system VapC family toxin [Gemmatimonadaceae bacterium]